MYELTHHHSLFENSPHHRYAANHKLDMSFISDEMEKILQEEQMMESFTRNAERELEKMFDMVQAEEGQERAVHRKMVCC